MKNGELFLYNKWTFLKLASLTNETLRLEGISVCIKKKNSYKSTRNIGIQKDQTKTKLQIRQFSKRSRENGYQKWRIYKGTTLIAK